MQLLKKNSLFESTRVFFIRLTMIRPNPGQPRRIFDTEGLRELAESIRQYGVLQPLTVRKISSSNYELVAGERRLRASRLAGLEEVPCILLGADEKQSSLIALVENLQRCDLDFFEEAEGVQRLITQFGLSQDEVAKRIGKSQSAVANKLRLLKHPPELIASIREHSLTERHARALLRLEDFDDKMSAIDTIIERGLNVAQTDEYIDDYISHMVEPPKLKAFQPPKVKTLYIFKDVRLFLNTVTRAVDTIKKSGIEAGIDKHEENGEIVLTIKIQNGC